MSITVYIHIRHWLFWYGNYRFCENSCNDEIVIYKDKNKEEFLGYFEVTTHSGLRSILNSQDELAEEDPELYREIKEFLNSENKIHYSYIYPRNEEDVNYQVKHNAPKNENGYKPIYIHMWSKLSDYWNEDEIKKAVKIIMKEFFNKDIVNVEILDIPTVKQTELSYNEDYGEGESGIG